MSRRKADRLLDILAACEAIARYLKRADIDEEIVFDAIRARLIEIGEAVKDLDEDSVISEPDIPWSDITRMRDYLAHRYFDTTYAIVTATARHDVPELAKATQRMLDRVNATRDNRGEWAVPPYHRHRLQNPRPLICEQLPDALRFVNHEQAESLDQRQKLRLARTPDCSAVRARRRALRPRRDLTARARHPTRAHWWS